MNELHLFAGAGGGILAGQLLGHRCVCAVEWEPYAQAVLVARQNDGTFPPFPIWDDVQTFDGKPWAGIVDIVAGGFPCQDISSAGGGQALTASAAACGATWPGSLARYDRATSLWKTAQCSLLGDSEEYLETWPRWGLMRDGACWEQPTLAPRTSASGFGLWRTPSAHVIEAKSTVTKLTGRKPSDPQVGLADQVMARVLWPTPSASDSSRGGTITDNMTGTSLVQVVNTPKYWPTPTVCGNYNRKGLSATSGDGLATKVMQWPTPVATMHKGWSPNHNRADTDNRLDYSVERESFQLGQPTPPMRLNPNWVEWLMGWPIGHTDLKPLATAKYQEWQQQHGRC